MDEEKLAFLRIPHPPNHSTGYQETFVIVLVVAGLPRAAGRWPGLLAAGLLGVSPWSPPAVGDEVSGPRSQRSKLQGGQLSH